MQGRSFFAVLLLFLIITCGCTGNTSIPGNPPGKTDDMGYLDLLDAFYSPLNQSYNPNQRQAPEVISENRKRAAEARAVAVSYHDAVQATGVSPALEPSKESFMRSMDELKAMSEYMLTPLYAEKTYAEMSADEQARADAYSGHSQNYGSLMAEIYNSGTCTAALEKHRNLTHMCTLVRSLQT